MDTDGSEVWDAVSDADTSGVYETEFALWAPHAEAVYVTGTFNGWNDTSHALTRDGNDHWHARVNGIHKGDEYLFVIHNSGKVFRKPDPRALQMTNSIGNSVWFPPNDFMWTDADFRTPNWNEQVIYEMHVGAFNDTPGGTPGTFETTIAKLDALAELGVNMLQLMPVAEFAGDFSWGYNGAHPFAIESGYGGREKLKALVNAAHQRGMGVIIDVVYNHWGPQDMSLWCFDGECLNASPSDANGGVYFYTGDRRESGWGPRPDYGREEVRQYIVDNVMMFLDEYHVDGLRFDSTVNIRKASGRDLPDGWALLQRIQNTVDARFPGRIMIAEDLQNDPWIAKPTSEGGAGFDAEWDSSFFHPIHQQLLISNSRDRSMSVIRNALLGYNLPFRRVVYTENHDEVANGKSRLPQMISPMSPADWQARKRSMLGAALVMTAPAIPMLFMGQEFLEDEYFRDSDPLDWNKRERFSGVYRYYQDLIRLRMNRTGQTQGLTGEGVSVYHVNETDKVLAMKRWHSGGDDVVVIVNFTEQSHEAYALGVPFCGTWQVRFNGDAQVYGTDFGNVGVSSVNAEAVSRDGQPCHVTLPLGQLAAVILSRD